MSLHEFAIVDLNFLAYTEFFFNLRDGVNRGWPENCFVTKPIPCQQFRTHKNSRDNSIIFLPCGFTKIEAIAFVLGQFEIFMLILSVYENAVFDGGEVVAICFVEERGAFFEGLDDEVCVGN
ncbi:hypothetical protein BELL_0572g00050 [Botrytis elliptica]|uniref:Uncharacterized protein n=1 Tax=Botrytis elliptica TaxID=278938 RepID=A0A4Z1JCL6_9HELO|nr:hypothetical protein BELL_0572g00050 [Botrytis elliptica]